jgi:hypothetical protein
MLHRLARVYGEQGEPERARDTTRQAAEIAVEIGDEELLRLCQSMPAQ